MLITEEISRRQAAESIWVWDPGPRPIQHVDGRGDNAGYPDPRAHYKLTLGFNTEPLSKTLGNIHYPAPLMEGKVVRGQGAMGPSTGYISPAPQPRHKWSR